MVGMAVLLVMQAACDARVHLLLFQHITVQQHPPVDEVWMEPE
jgi:hypothetical protein